jgi:hypothetical protein
VEAQTVWWYDDRASPESECLDHLAAEPPASQPVNPIHASEHPLGGQASEEYFRRSQEFWEQR